MLSSLSAQFLAVLVLDDYALELGVRGVWISGVWVMGLWLASWGMQG